MLSSKSCAVGIGGIKSDRNKCLVFMVFRSILFMDCLQVTAALPC